MISIIIPTYNTEAYLRECLESAIRQDYTDKEIIVVNDGSTDSTKDILSEYDSIKVIDTPNYGLSAARNTGIEAASGKWITFLDSDDTLASGALRHLEETAETLDADICIGGQKNAVILSPDKALKETLYRTIDGSAWGKLYKREILIEERFTPGLYYEDLDLLIRLYTKVSRIVTCDKEVYHYRNNPEGISKAFTQRRFDILKVTGKIEEYLRSQSPSIRRSARNRRLAACMHIIHMLRKNNAEKDYAEIADLCRNEIQRLRAEAITDPHSRNIVRLGALLSYLGIYI